MDASNMAITKPQHNKQYPVEYSLVELVYVDGTTTSFMVKAGLGIAKYLRDELRDHQSLTLRNDTDVLVVVREQLRSFTLRAMTKENN
jgi:hypothetical protein